MHSSVLLWLWLQRYLPKLPYFRKLVLTTISGATDSPPPQIETNVWPFVGARGRAVSDLYPGGKASFYDPSIGDERVTQVVGEGGYIVAGTGVIVSEIAGNRVVVRAQT
jgi:hypothetical protein